MLHKHNKVLQSADNFHAKPKFMSLRLSYEKIQLIIDKGCFFNWSALKNDYVLDYIVNPIKKVSVELGFGPPSADFGSIWSSQKARKFRHVQKKNIKSV